jgi:hypothetical protein
VRARVAATVLLGVLVASCAKVAPPPGGPEDRDPPTIVDVFPPRDAAGVAPDSALTILFSEEPDRRTVMRALAVYPAAEFAQTEWVGPALRLVPGTPWPSDRPTLVVLAGTARDRRGNELGDAFRWRFWTGDAPDPGAVEGRVWPGREVPRGTGVVVTAYVAADSLDPESAHPVAITDAQSDGAFRIDGLNPDQEYQLIAVLDRNGDARLGERGEIWQEAPERVRFPSPHSLLIRASEFLLGTLDTVGFLEGEVSADSAAPAIVFATSGGDSVSQDLDGGGPFSLEVPTGAEYRIAAFLDLDGNSRADEGEPIVEHDAELPLRLTARQSGIRFDLQGLAPPTVPDSSSAPSEPEDAEEESAPEDSP